MTEEEHAALVRTAQYKFYKDYVEDLEKAHDALLGKIENAIAAIKKLKKEAKEKDTRIAALEQENQRQRELNAELYRKFNKQADLLKQYRGY